MTKSGSERSPEHRRLLQFLAQVRADNGRPTLREIGQRLNRDHSGVSKLLNGRAIGMDEGKLRLFVREGLGGSREDADRAVELLREARAAKAPAVSWRWSGIDAHGHFHSRGLGQLNAGRGGDLFQGRLAAVERIRAWLLDDVAPGQSLVVTGEPGSGKSTVVARAVAEVGARGSTGLAIHARGMTHADLVSALGEVMDQRGPIERYQLLRFLGQSEGCHRFVVDALDEAHSPVDLEEMARTVSAIAAIPSVRVVVALRPRTADDRFGRRSPLRALGADGPEASNLIDIDREEYFERSELEAYASALLAQSDAEFPGPPGRAWTRYRDDEALRDRLARTIAERAGRCFLVAAIAADRLSTASEVVDPSDPAFDTTTIPSSTGEALTRLLDALPGETRHRDEALLTALAYARGAGIDDEQWIRFGRALGYQVGPDDLDRLRASPASDFLLESQPRDEDDPVTRLFHQVLVDDLLRQRGRRRINDEQRIAVSLNPARHEDWASATAYQRTYVGDHAAAAGRLTVLLKSPHYLAAADLARLLPHWPDDQFRELYAVAKMAARRSAGATPTRQAQLLALAATHLGLPDARDQFAALAPAGFAPVWAHAAGSPHQCLRGGREPVNAVALGRLAGRDVIASGGDDDLVRLWDGQGRPAARPLRGHTSSVRAVALGRLDHRDVIVSGSVDRTIRIWDDRGEPIGTPLVGHSGVVSALALGRLDDREVIVSASSDATVRLWDGQGAPIGEPLTRHTEPVRTVAIGRLSGQCVIAAGAEDGTIRTWRPDGSSFVDGMTGHVGPVRGLAFVRLGDTDILVSGSDDGTIRPWDHQGKPTGDPITVPGGAVTALAIGRFDGRDVIVSGGEDRTVRRWGLDGRPVDEPLIGHFQEVSAVAVGTLAGSDVIVSAGDASVRIWDSRDLRIGQPVIGHTGLTSAVAVARFERGGLVVSAGDDDTVRTWDPLGRSLGAALPDARSVQGIAAGRLADREVIVSGGIDGVIRVWDPEGNVVRSWSTGPHRPVRAVALGRLGDRDVIVSAGTDMTLRIWDGDGGPVGATLAGHQGPVQAVALGRLGTRDIVVSGGLDRTVRRWDVDGVAIGAPLTGHDGAVQAIAVGRLGGRDVIVSGGHDRTVRIWDEHGDAVGEPSTGHSEWVTALAIGSWGIVSGSYDRTVRLWHPGNGDQVQIFELFDVVRGLAMAEHGIIVASGLALIALRIDGAD